MNALEINRNEYAGNASGRPSATNKKPARNRGSAEGAAASTGSEARAAAGSEDPGTRGAGDAFLHGPVAGPLMRLALPVLIVLAVQTLVGVAETYFVGFLGTDAIAGVALVFPLLMLMTMMSNGAIGGGVSSAIARAIGGGRKADADALVMHALILATVFGAAFTLGTFAAARALFESMGAKGQALQIALQYAYLVFGVAIPVWITNLLAAALRGAGNVRIPAIVTVGGAAITLAISPPLILGLGPFPRLGVAGAGIAVIVYYVLATAAFLVYLRRPDAPVRLVRAPIEWRLMKDILRVGVPSAVGTLAANLTVVLTTGLVGNFGAEAIAGYGVASRLDYLLIPLLFAIGTASVTMVGTNIGAGNVVRARRIAWVAAGVTAATTGLIGLAATLWPEAWVGLFSHDPAVIEVGVLYLHRVAPLYALYGVGMSLYFSSQGAGRMVWPFLAGIGRLVAVMAIGGYWVTALHGSISGLFWISAGSMALFAMIIVAAFATGRAWQAPDKGNAAPAAGRAVPRMPIAGMPAKAPQ